MAGNDNQNQTQPSLSTSPPPTLMSTGGNVLQSTTKLAPRKATNVAPTIQIRETEYTPAGYTGQNLIDKNGVISRGQYSEDEAYNELVKIGTPAERFAFLNRLAANGLYGKGRPSSTGLSSRDLTAMRQALLTANSLGYTVDVAINKISADPAFAYARQGVAKKIRTSPKQDLRAVFKKVSQDVLGRDLADSEVEKFVKAYTQMEVTQAKGGATAPSAAVAAEAQVRKKAPAEAGAIGVLRLAEIMDQSLKGLG